jgi:hypothetical protein
MLMSRTDLGNHAEQSVVWVASHHLRHSDSRHPVNSWRMAYVSPPSRA